MRHKLKRLTFRYLALGGTRSAAPEANPTIWLRPDRQGQALFCNNLIDLTELVNPPVSGAFCRFWHSTDKMRCYAARAYAPVMGRAYASRMTISSATSPLDGSEGGHAYA